MLNLKDGPAQGIYRCTRAPSYLRAVIADDSPKYHRNGGRDVLDQIDDTPKPTERLFVYRLIGEPGTIIMCGRGAGDGGMYASATYAHTSDVDGERLRDTAAWQNWATEQYLAKH